MDWSRIQRLELELAQQEARFRAEIDELSEQVAHLREARTRLIESRDLARRVAMRLEEENHLLAAASPVCAICAGEVVTEISVNTDGSGTGFVLPNEEEPRKCAICAEEVRVTRDGHPYHYSARADIGDHHATLAEFEHGAFCECPRCNERHGAPVKVEQTPNPAQTEPPVGSVARCTGCGNVYVHRPTGWLDTDRPWRTDSWQDIANSFCGPVKVIHNPEEDK